MPNVNCPHCQGALEFLPQWAGQTVTCPFCQGVFQMPMQLPTVAAPAARPAPAPAAKRARSAGARPEGSQVRRRESPPLEPGLEQPRSYAIGRVQIPAVLLLLSALVGTAWSGYVSVQLGLQIQRGLIPENLPDVEGIDPTKVLQVAMLFSVMVVIANIGVFVSMMQMLALRGHTLCVVGALISLVPCTGPCCLLNLPLGIWALVVLYDPEVRGHFSRL